MSLLCYQYMRTTRKLSYIVSYAIFLVFVIFRIISSNISVISAINSNMLQALTFLNITLKFAYLIFVFFMIMTFEYAREIRRVFINEVFDTVPCGRKQVYGSIISFQILLLSILALSILLINVISYEIIGISSKVVLVHIVKNILINLWLIPIIGILLGCILASLSRSVVAILIMLSVAYTTSPAAGRIESIITTSIPQLTSVIHKVHSLFNIFTPALDAEPDAVFGYSLLPYRIELIGLWFLIMLVFYVYNLNLRNKGITIFVCIILSITACFILIRFMQPSSVVIRSQYSYDTVYDDWEYYANNEQFSEEANYVITEYDIQLKIGRSISAIIEIKVDDASLDEYKMTLYHKFKIYNIETKSGDELAFEQNGDCLRIIKNNSDISEGIVIYYNGTSNKFYATVQGTYLPGYFPYYPKAGYYTLFDNDLFGFNRVINSSNTQYTVEVLSSDDFYCNLDQIKKNKFSGECSDVSLVSGFYKVKKIDDTKIVYPYLDWVNCTEEEMIEGYNKCLDENIINPKIKTIFVMPAINASSVYERVTGFSDHLTISSFYELYEYYDDQEIDNNKLVLYNILSLYYEDPDELFQRANAFKSSIDTDSDYEAQSFLYTNPTVIFAGLIEEKGESKIIPACEQYLHDKQNEMDTIEFLHSLTKLPDQTHEEKISSEKQRLEYIIAEYNDDYYKFSGHVNMMRELSTMEDNPDRELFEQAILIDIRVCLQNAIDIHGETLILGYCREYVSDENDIRDPVTFLQLLSNMEDIK